MKDLVARMNHILDECKKELKYVLAFPMEFSQKEDGLYFNDTYLCKETDLTLTGAEVNLDEITFFFEEDHVIVIQLAWTEDRPPEIESVVFCSRFEKEERDKTLVETYTEEFGITFADLDEIPDEEPEEVREYDI